MGKTIAFATLLLSALFACNLPARALDLVPLSIDQLIDKSPRIVVATCASTETRAVKAYGDNPFTFTRFDHVETLAGDLSGAFELRLFGGRVGDVRVWEDGLPSFAPGTRYLLFLGPSNKDGFPLLKPQGIFEVLKPDSGQTAERLRATLGQGNPEQSLAQIRERVRARRAGTPPAADARQKKTSIKSHDLKARSRGPMTAADRQLPAP